jgi:hypothetical protein
VQSLESLPSVPSITTVASDPTYLNSRGIARRETEPVPTTARNQQPPEWYGQKQFKGQPRETETERLQRKAREIREREEQEKQILRENQERIQNEAEQARLAREETERVLAEQKRKDLERLEMELEAAAPRASTMTSSKEKFSFFSRKRSASTAAHTASPKATPGNIAVTAPLSLSRPPGPPSIGIEKGGGGIVPGTDAPISAVNAGERVSSRMT